MRFVPRRIPIATLIALALCCAVNSGLFFSGIQLGGLKELIPQAGNKPITLPAVIFSSAIPVLLAGLLAFVLHRTMPKRAAIVWRIVVLSLSALSLINPFMIPEASNNTLGVLIMMHVALAGITVFTFGMQAMEEVWDEEPEAEPAV